MEQEEVKIVPLTRVVDIRHMPEERKNATFANIEPEISTALQLGEYICKNKTTFPPDLLRLTEEKTLLDELRLKHLRLNKPGIKHLSVLLPFIKQISFADFTDMQLDPNDIELLSMPISKLVNLEEVSLSTNNIGLGALHLAKALPSLKSLKILDISDCNMNSTAIIALCQGLGHLKMLALLQLSFNQLDFEGTEALCNTIHMMPLLVELELFTCGITDKSFKNLENGFKNTRLESVLLGNNNLSYKIQGKLKNQFPFVHFGVKKHSCSIM